MSAESKEKEVALHVVIPISLKKRIRQRIKEQGDQRRIVIEALEIGLDTMDIKDQLLTNGWEDGKPL
jgi:hypothetical protein